MSVMIALTETHRHSLSCRGLTVSAQTEWPTARQSCHSRDRNRRRTGSFPSGNTVSTLCPDKPKFHLARHVLTRHATSPVHFGIGKSRDVLCRACRIARRDTLVTTGATRTTRVQRRPAHFFQKLFLRLMQIQSTRD